MHIACAELQLTTTRGKAYCQSASLIESQPHAPCPVGQRLVIINHKVWSFQDKSIFIVKHWLIWFVCMSFENINEQRDEIIKSRLSFLRMSTPRTGKELFGRTKALKVKPLKLISSTRRRMAIHYRLPTPLANTNTLCAVSGSGER